jgi:hypothetical protein
MPFKPDPWVLSVLLCISAFSPASAQTVYKCGTGDSVTYTEKACGGRIVNTDDAPVPARAGDARRVERNRAMAQSMRPREGESAEQFETRRRRAPLLRADRDECARLDKRMPVEEESMKNPDPAEVLKAEEALARSRKRFGDLKC